MQSPWRRPFFILWSSLMVAGHVSLAAPESSTLQRVAPPRGVAIEAKIRTDLEHRVGELRELIESLPQRTGNAHVTRRRPVEAGSAQVELRTLIPDAAIYLKAVEWALKYDEFLRSNDVAVARQLLDRGWERAQALADGRAPWLEVTGLVVRAYLSKIDGSIQPYGLVVPASYPDSRQPHRLDVWLHGRDNNLTELKFIAGRERSWGEFTPPDTIVLHPYGRYCNAFKFAGEIDVLEALEHARTQYAVDERRLAIRGFSMGGAGVWHLAVHHAGLWAAASPGAGFAETAEYSGILRREPDLPWYERRLWHLYDATDYALNLFHCPTIAYSGELDKQKQAADIMERAMTEEGLKLVHMIGPNTAHQYEPEIKKALSRQFDDWMSQPQNLMPSKIRFTTWTLRYPTLHWITVEGMERHWDRARVEASVENERSLRLKTENVDALTVSPWPLSSSAENGWNLELDGQRLTIRNGQLNALDDKPALRLTKADGRWRVGSWQRTRDLRKRPGLQGPIDDAFLDRFIMVRPTGQPLHRETGAWIETAMADALLQWRAQFRGDAIVKDDADLTPEDIKASHLILWGDPQSNLVLRRILKELPITWSSEKLAWGPSEATAQDHVPVLVYPNPLQPDRYVVLNSGFTFSKAGKLSNSLQTPKLPDWAIARVSPTGNETIVAGGFFNETWGWEISSP